MRLKKDAPTKKVRVMVLELHGKKAVYSKSVSCYDTNGGEIFAIVEKALRAAERKGGEEV